MRSWIPRQAILVCFLHFAEGLRLTINHPRGIIGPPATRGNELLVPLNGYPLGITSPTILPDGGELPAPPQQSDSKKGWVGRLIRKVWEKVKTIVVP